MATATKTTEKVPVTVFKEQATVTLTLSKPEAEAMLDIFRLVGGDPYTSRRGLISNILVALKSADIAPDEDRSSDITPGRLYFNDNV